VVFYLIPLPLLLEEKGRVSAKVIRILAPLLKERGWGEVQLKC